MTSFFAHEPVPANLSGWSTLADLANDPAARIGEVGVALRTSDRRVAASTDLLTVAARVLSPALLVISEHDAIPVVSAESIWWRQDRPHPMRIAFDVERFVPLDAAAFVDALVAPALAPVVDGYCSAGRLSRLVAWGNVASALNAAAGILQSAPVNDLVLAALQVGPLEGTAHRLAPHFVRASCCLYYRVAPGALCSDCVLGQSR